MLSCHVERVLDDRVWRLFGDLHAGRPFGFTPTPLVRSPAFAEGEAGGPWLERVRALAARAPIGHHTHFGGVHHARPRIAGGTGELVRSEAVWLREHGLAPAWFCGGGWYLDRDVAGAVADLGYADTTAVTAVPRYWIEGARHLALRGPAWVRLDNGRRFFELPSSHSLGTAVRDLLWRGTAGEPVHIHIHDWELLDRRRRAALHAVLRVLAVTHRPLPLEAVIAEFADAAPEVLLSHVLVGDELNPHVPPEPHGLRRLATFLPSAASRRRPPSASGEVRRAGRPGRDAA